MSDEVKLRYCHPELGGRHDDPDNSGVCIYCGGIVPEDEAEGREQRAEAEAIRREQ